MSDHYETQKLPKFEDEKAVSRGQQTRNIMMRVCEALEEKGYSPVNQLTGYIMSGDPTYITSHRDARKIIGRLERDELLEELIDFYLYDHGQS